MAAINESLRLYEDTYDEKSYTDVNRLANALLTQADTLSPIVTRLYGSMSKRFPLMLLTEGRNKIRTVKSADGLFKVPIMGKPKKTSLVTKYFYTTGDTPGKGKSEFLVGFSDRWFERDYMIESPTGTQCKIVTDPRQEGDTWIYTLRIMGKTFTEYCPLTELTVGKRWAKMWAPVGISGSRGNASRNQAPAMMQNQTSFLRKSYAYKGNVQNKVMVISIPTDSGNVEYWCEWEAYMRALEWKEECENALWYSKFNRDDVTNEIHDKDINSGEVITMSSGMLEQIPNTSTYSYLTEDKMKRTMRDVFYNSTGDIKKIEIFVGTGSREEVDNALKNSIKGLTLVDSKFLQGNGPQDLVFGSYFSTYRHVDGHMATIRYLPLLDYGARAEKANRHPITNLPMTSYDIYYIDMSTIEGESNVTYVAEEGREDMEVFVPGLTIPKGYSGNGAMRASDADQSSVHFAKSLAVHMKNPINSFKLTCDLA